MKIAFDGLSYLQKIRIAQAEIDCCPNTMVMDMLNDEEVWEDIKNHPSYVLGCIEKEIYLSKGLLNDAEYEVKAKYAYSIYMSVKNVLDKGERLT